MISTRCTAINEIAYNLGVLERPIQHEIDDEGNALFLGLFTKFAVNPSRRDYGWDYAIEAFHEGNRTGLVFAGQLKSSRSTVYSSDGSYVSQRLDTKAAQYLSTKLQQPTFLFHADVIRRKIFWDAVQLDQRLLQHLEAKPRRHLTVRIPTSNVLPDNWERFGLELIQSKSIVASRILLSTGVRDFVEAMAGQAKRYQSNLASDLHVKGFHLELQQAWSQMRDGSLMDGIQTARRVVRTSVDFQEVQFHAVLLLGELEVLELSRSRNPQALVSRRKLQTALDLQNIAGRNPRHLHLYAVLSRLAAEIGVAIHDMHGLSMNWRNHRNRGDDQVWTAVLWNKALERFMVVNRKYRQAIRLASATAKSQYRGMTARPLADLAIWVLTVARTIQALGLDAVAKQYESNSFQLIEFAAEIATEASSDEDLHHVLGLARLLETQADGEVITWIRSRASIWPESSSYRTTIEELIQKTIARLNGKVFEGDIQTTKRQIFYNVLTPFDIDPMQEPWSSLVDLAIIDEDPTRVLRSCEQKIILRHPLRVPVLDRIGLETANPKILRCRLHGHAAEGRALDDIDAVFVKSFCDTCSDQKPRSSEWQFHEDRRPLPDE